MVLAERQIHKKYSKSAILEKIVSIGAAAGGADEQKFPIARDDLAERSRSRFAVCDDTDADW
jgi:hypothetical protein